MLKVIYKFFQEKYSEERRQDGESEYQLGKAKKGVYTERELVRWPPDLQLTGPAKAVQKI